jgi:hypothetical protein
MSKIIKIDEVMRMYKVFTSLYDSMYFYSNSIKNFANHYNISLNLAKKIIQMGRIRS